MKKRIALLLALTLCLSLLAACGSQGAGESTTPDPSQTVQPSQEPSAAPTEEPSQAPSQAPEGVPSEAPSQEPSQAPEESPSLTLSMTDATITYAGYVLTLTPTFSGFGTDSTALSWSSSDESVATVDEAGNVTSVAPGKAVITAESYTGIQASCIVRCRWTEESSAPTETGSQTPTGSTTLADFAAKTIETYGISLVGQQANDTELMDSLLPGLTAVKTNQMQVYLSLMSMNMGELALVEVSDSADVATVKAIFQARIDYMVGDGNGPGGAWYPEPTAMWEENSRVVSSGNYVMMVINENCDAIVADFEAQF